MKVSTSLKQGTGKSTIGTPTPGNNNNTQVCDTTRLNVYVRTAQVPIALSHSTIRSWRHTRATGFEQANERTTTLHSRSHPSDWVREARHGSSVFLYLAALDAPLLQPAHAVSYRLGKGLLLPALEERRVGRAPATQQTKTTTTK